MKKEWTIGNLLSVSSAYWKGCALQAGVRLGIFTAIHDREVDLTAIARAVECDVRGTEYLLNALAAMGLLIKDGSQYANSAAAVELLSRESPKYMGHIILHHHHILDGWAQLDQAVRKGAPVRKRSYGEEAERESFLMGMFNLAMGIAPRLASELDLTGRKRLLDLGGGPGTYAIHFCKANPDLSAVIFDRETTRPFAEATIRRFDLTGRIEFAGGDFHDDPLPEGPFDAAWLSHILHSSGPEECQRIIKRTAGVMQPGGLILIHDFILDDTRDGPEFAALFALNMLVHNPQGRTYSRREIGGMLEKAGVRNISLHPFRGPNDSAIMYGTV
ncbi:MAG: methyltransferase [Desulfobulbaceae bacterium]|nr:methyltransferase [Desulfobulbaceae bacterium]